MQAIEALRQKLPETAKDIKLNLQAVLGESSLSNEQKWGVAVASALASRNAAVREAVLADAAAAVPQTVIQDAAAAATLMAMNNVYYRFRHVVGKPSYATKPARLRMNRMMQPTTSKIDLELFSLVVSAINNCEACVKAHEKVVTEGGVTEDQVNDAIRIAATINAAAIALESGI